jgi:hypothetical protein
MLGVFYSVELFSRVSIMIPPSYSFDRLWRALLLLVVAAFVNSGRAKAECGDYISIRIPGSNADLAQTTPSFRDRSVHERGDTSPIELPCKGPHCSRSPVREIPPLAPIIPLGFEGKELVQNLAATHEDVAFSFLFVRDNTPLRPISWASSVFHPPR